LLVCFLIHSAPSSFKTEIEVPPALDVDFINPDLPLGKQKEKLFHALLLCTYKNILKYS
jgi:hypothetical protein